MITQLAMAFSTAVAAFSLFVTQFQSLSAFAAVVARLKSMVDALDSAQPPMSAIQIVEQDGPLAYEALTLSSRTNEGRLIENLSLTIPFGARVLVNGTSPDAGIALFKATAGIWTTGEGRIVRPRAPDILFLPQSLICHRAQCGRCLRLRSAKAKSRATASWTCFVNSDLNKC